jgi:predicted nuclease of predicted toxin-antitoxin system
MKLLFDQNISPKLVESLKDWFPNSVHVQNIGLDKATDSEIWEYAKGNDFILISKDADFAERSLLYGYPPFVIWIRKGNCLTKDIVNILTENHQLIKEFIQIKKSGLLNLY